MSNVPQETAPKSDAGASAKSGRGEARPHLPDASVFQFGPVPPGPAAPAVSPGEATDREARKPAGKPAGSAMFEALVTGENDLVGFVAYGFYKQSKRDFLSVFENAHGRVPDGAEIRAYMTGEATPRRVATYRHLAENFLASYGDGRTADDEKTSPDSPFQADRAMPPPRTLTQLLGRPLAARRRRGPSWLTAAYLAFLVLLLAAMVVLIRGGFSPLGAR